MTARSHRELIVWQKAMDMAVQVYAISKRFPDQERFAMVSQVTRAGASVAANIAEGNARSTPKEYSHFLAIARGSLMETETWLELAIRLEYMSQSDVQGTLALIVEIDKMLWTMRAKLNANREE